MRYFIQGREYLCVDKYVDAVMDYYKEHQDCDANFCVLTSDGKDWVGGFIPNKPYTHDGLYEGLKYLEKYLGL